MLVDRILADLDLPDREVFEGALVDPATWSNGGLSRAMRANGIEVSEGAIRNWRIKNGVAK